MTKIQMARIIIEATYKHTKHAEKVAAAGDSHWSIQAAMKKKKVDMEAALPIAQRILTLAK